MSGLVVDASILVRWISDEAAPPLAHSIGERLVAHSWEAVAPRLLLLEVANALVITERRGVLRRSFPEAWASAATWLARVQLDEGAGSCLQQVCELARQYGLTAYDASYLELARRRQIPLATLDRQLGKAARAAGVQVEC